MATFCAGHGLALSLAAALALSACAHQTQELRAPAAASGSARPQPTSTGDADLDELRRLAVAAPVAELCERADLFLNLKGLEYPEDAILWRGVGRLADEAIRNRERPFARNTLSLLIRFIEQAEPPAELELERRLEGLRSRRDRTPRRIATADAETQPTGDAELDELRRLAVDAPIEELLAKAIPFMSLRSHSYRSDAIAWRGLDRLCAKILQNPDRSINSTVIGMLIGQLEGGRGDGNDTSQAADADRIARLRQRLEESQRTR